MTQYEVFKEIDGTSLKRKIEAGDLEFEIIDVPPKFTKQQLNPNIKAVRFGEKLAPYLLCYRCHSVFKWYKLDSCRNLWINQSGIKTIKNHLDQFCMLKSCKSPPLTGLHVSANKLKSSCKDKKKNELSNRKTVALPQVEKLHWFDKIIEVLSNNPSISIPACCDVASAISTYVSVTTHISQKLYNFDIKSPEITDYLLRRGEQAKFQLQTIFRHASSSQHCGIGCVLDIWSDSQKCYGGLICTGIDENWEWFQFPLELKQCSRCIEEEPFIFANLTDCNFHQAVTDPFFITTNTINHNVAPHIEFIKLLGSNFAGIIGCTECSLSSCIDGAFEGVNTELCFILENLQNIETFYDHNVVSSMKLPQLFPKKRATLQWKYYYSQFFAHIENFTLYQSEECRDYELPNLSQLQGIFNVLELLKSFFDKMTVLGPTSQISFMNYLVLDVKLYETNQTTDYPVIRQLTSDLRFQMTEKLWTYCGSPFAVTAAYLTGVDVPAKIYSLLNSTVTSPNNSWDQEFMSSWMAVAGSFGTIVCDYLTDLFGTTTTLQKTPQSEEVQSTSSSDLFEKLFESTSEGQTSDTSTAGSSVAWEMRIFDEIKVPSKDPQINFQRNNQTALLKRAAKVLLSVPATSLMMDHLCSDVGLNLTTSLENRSVEIVTALIYIHYADKYQKLFEKIAVNIDPVNTDHAVKTNYGAVNIENTVLINPDSTLDFDATSSVDSDGADKDYLIPPLELLHSMIKHEESPLVDLLQNTIE